MADIHKIPSKNLALWRDFRQLNRQQLPDGVRPWLLDRGSLTERLISASAGNFRVQLIEQSWRLPTLDEARLLKLKSSQRALVREVLLLCNNEPWVYARSVLPGSSLHGSLRFLRKLKNSALGGLLFKDPHLKRSRFEVAQLQLPKKNIPLSSKTTNTAMVFGRRSLFHLHQQPLLVAEIFLPASKLYEHHKSIAQLSMHGQIGL